MLEAEAKVVFRMSSLSVNGDPILELENGRVPSKHRDGRFIPPLQRWWSQHLSGKGLHVITLEALPETPTETISDTILTLGRIQDTNVYQLTAQNTSGARVALPFCSGWGGAHPCQEALARWYPQYTSALEQLRVLDPHDSQELVLATPIVSVGEKGLEVRSLVDVAGKSRFVVPLSSSWRRTCPGKVIAPYEAAGLLPPPCAFNYAPLVAHLEMLKQNGCGSFQSTLLTTLSFGFRVGLATGGTFPSA